MAQLKLAATDAKTIAQRSGIGGGKTRVILFAKNESATVQYAGVDTQYGSAALGQLDAVQPMRHVTFLAWFRF
jgi:hypothetical protein